MFHRKKLHARATIQHQPEQQQQHKNATQFLPPRLRGVPSSLVDSILCYSASRQEAAHIEIYILTIANMHPVADGCCGMEKTINLKTTKQQLVLARGA